MGCSVLGDVATPVVGMRKLSSAKSRQPADPCNGTSLLPLTTDPKLRHDSQVDGRTDRIRGRLRADIDNVCFDLRHLHFETLILLHFTRVKLVSVTSVPLGVLCRRLTGLGREVTLSTKKAFLLSPQPYRSLF